MGPIPPNFLDEREDEEPYVGCKQFPDGTWRPVAMPGSGAPVLKIGEGCYLTLPTNPD